MAELCSDCGWPMFKPMDRDATGKCFAKYYLAAGGDDDGACLRRTVAKLRARVTELEALAAAPQPVKAQRDERERFFLGQDSSAHWYVVPVAKRGEWDAWCNLDEDDAAGWDPPDFAERLNGGPSSFCFERANLSAAVEPATSRTAEATPPRL